MLHRLETIDGSATEGEDYVPVNEVLTFEPYETEKEVASDRDMATVPSRSA